MFPYSYFLLSNNKSTKPNTRVRSKIYISFRDKLDYPELN